MINLATEHGAVSRPDKMKRGRFLERYRSRFPLTFGAIVAPTVLFWILLYAFPGLDDPATANPLGGVPLLGALWAAIITAISWVLSLTWDRREEFSLLMVFALYPIFLLAFVLKRWYASAAAVVIVPLLLWWVIIYNISRD